MPIVYIIGDATSAHIGQTPRYLAHVCNNIGKWGRGFVLAVSNRWGRPEAEYRRRFKMGNLKLGDNQFVSVQDPNVFAVVNMIAQNGIRSPSNLIPLRYDALKSCLEHLARIVSKDGGSVHMPRIGAGLAGGNWTNIEKIINDAFGPFNIEVFVYDLPQKKGAR